MDSTYGFVELWLAAELKVESIDYPLESGNMVAAVDLTGFNTIINIVQRLWQDLSGSDPHLQPTTVNTAVAGMKTLLHCYWANDEILDEITGEEAKDVPQYNAIKSLGPSGARFNLVNIKNKIQEYINPKPKPGPNNTTGTGEAVPESSEGTVEEEKPKPKPKEISAYQKKINYFIAHIERFRTSVVKSKTEADDYVVISFGEYLTPDLEKSFVGLAKDIKKNVILIRDSSYASYVISTMKNDYKLSEVADHTLFFITAEYGKGFNYYSHSSMICLGHDIKSLHSMGADNSLNDELEKVRKNRELSPDERDKKAKEILSKQTNTPLYKFDEVFKDTATNVIWALKDRCIVYLMVNFEPSHHKFYTTALHEFGRRFNHSVAYDTLKEIDQAYLDTMHDGNREDYITFSVNNSSIIIDELKRKRDEHYKLYKDHFTKAMEHAKIFQRYADQISCFDEDAFLKKERKKAEDAYDETLAIDLVSAIIVKDNTVYVYTNNIYVQDERTNNWHDIGTFQIAIGMHRNEYDTGKTVRIKNTKYQIEAFSSKMQAPHVWEDGHICHGNLATGMIDAYKRRNMYELVYQIILFLGEANTADSAGEKINKWPEVSEEVVNKKAETDDKERYDKIHKLVEAEKSFDEMLANAIPVTI